MKKQTITIALVLSMIGAVVGYILDHSYDFGVCTYNTPSCFWFFERLGSAIFTGSLGLLIVFGLLWLMPKGFNLWKRFAIFYIPFALLVYIGYQDPGSGDFFSPHAVEVFPWISVVYVLMSAVLISYAHLKNKKVK